MPGLSYNGSLFITIRSIFPPKMYSLSYAWNGWFFHGLDMGMRIWFGIRIHQPHRWSKASQKARSPASSEKHRWILIAARPELEWLFIQMFIYAWNWWFSHGIDMGLRTWFGYVFHLPNRRSKASEKVRSTALSEKHRWLINFYNQ